MQKINKFLLKYLVYAIPFHVILLIWGLLASKFEFLKGIKPLAAAMDILPWNFIAWLIVLVFVLAELLWYPDMQRRFFESAAKFAGVKERDERESLAIDRAGRYAYISTLCLLIVMLCFYSINVTIGNIPPDKVVDGKHRYITVGIGIAVTDDKPVVKNDNYIKTFSNWDLPLSKWSLIFLVIAWHVLSFLYYLRKTDKYNLEK